MKPNTRLIEKWWKQASDEFAFTSDDEIRERFAELAAQWGAEQAKQIAEYGPLLTRAQAAECASMSGKVRCQACGVEWKQHH